MICLAIIILSLMSVGLTVCGILLWKRREETGDYSRHIQAIFSIVSAVFAFMFIFRTWNGSTTVEGAFLEPEHTFVPIFIQTLFFLYPLEVIRPTASRSMVYTLLFGPLLLLSIIGLCGGIEYTAIHTYADFWQHLPEPNVWFRLLTIVAMLFYGFSLFLVPYDWRNSSANRLFMRTYAVGFCLIGVLHFTVQLTHSYLFQLLHMVAWMSFFFGIAYYELRERLIPVKTATPQPKEETGDELWKRITTELEDKRAWSRTDMNMTLLSELVYSNRTYVNEAFRRNTGSSFGEYIAHHRIGFVVEEMKRNPHANVQDLFQKAGFRQRTTAWKCFHKIMGMSPTEFLETLK